MKSILLKKYELFLFDLDDTLFDHSSAFQRGIGDTLRQFNELKDLNQAEFLLAFTKHNHRLWPRFSSNELNFQQFSIMRLENTLADFNIDLAPKVSLQFVKTFQASYIQQIRPQQEIIKFLLDLSNKAQLGIVTNGTVFNAYKKVERLGLSNIFPDSSVIVSERIGFFKPHKGLFQHALDVFKSEPITTLFIGDNYFTDITGAKSVGMDALWINKHDYDSPDEIQPDYIVKHVLDMEELIIDGEWRESCDKNIRD
ncbi:hypothetical protein CN378_11805 [Bacillus sp. AFS015802]|uniref:HAD family hydrolase n=1 Tax=Bacillus sp. AFS015802 TaxID=2033486 RepID=UPI000BF40F6D|nr:HAD family hydrolase [Bacillus sp. AFS015802]PFA67059.1 hypothetical protein CN378_11805 [Bacillus sp. AFS015802]